ncbi:hypothetical protein BV372_25730 [Nostoc sp. T09]|nr:hypothetical protein BV372_25730 [Nostoc sp. T09]
MHLAICKQKVYFILNFPVVIGNFKNNLKYMSDNNTDTLKGWLIILAVIFILFLAAVVFIFLFSDFAFFNTQGLSIKQRLDYRTKALTRS